MYCVFKRTFNYLYYYVINHCVLSIAMPCVFKSVYIFVFNYTINHSVIGSVFKYSFNLYLITHVIAL